MRMPKLILCGLFLAGSWSSAADPSPTPFTQPSKAPANTASQSPFQQTLSLYEGLNRVGTQLLVGAARIDPKSHRYLYGFSVHDADFFEDESRPRSKRGRQNDGPRVTFVHPHMPASTAGLQVGDLLLAINGRPVEKLNSLEVLRYIQQLGYGDVEKLELAVDREGRVLTFTIPGRKAARLTVQFLEQTTPNVYGRGDEVFVTQGLLQEIPDANDRAFVVGREIARQLLHQKERLVQVMARDSLAKKFVGTNPFPAVANTNIIASAEAFAEKLQEEADQTSLDICLTMGFDVSNAPALLDKLDRLAGQDYRQKNPLNPNRLEALRKALFRMVGN